MTRTGIDDIIATRISEYKQYLKDKEIGKDVSGYMININPYTPGAGKQPKYLAGRDNIISKATRDIYHLINDNAKRPIIYYGLRGVGKTVLLNRISDIAKEKDVLCEFIEATDKRNFKNDLTASVITLMHKLSTSEKIKSKFKEAWGILKAFVIKWSPTESEISFGLDVENLMDIAGTGYYGNDCLKSLLALGELAKNNNSFVCFFIDEMHYLDKDELEAITVSIHRIGQLNLPIYFICAGLPKIIKDLADTVSYSERAFKFIHIDSLDKEYTSFALREPAKEHGVEYTDEAVNKIYDITKGYPYFIQIYGECIWEECIAYKNRKLIDINIVNSISSLFYEELDESFFKSRYDKATNAERRFMLAMAKCETLPCNISDVAERMGLKLKSVSTHRASLINKGLIYSKDFGTLDFSVPMFDDYLRRI